MHSDASQNGAVLKLMPNLANQEIIKSHHLGSQMYTFKNPLSSAWYKCAQFFTVIAASGSTSSSFSFRDAISTLWVDNCYLKKANNNYGGNVKQFFRIAKELQQEGLAKA
jgi:hypothetical protein